MSKITRFLVTTGMLFAAPVVFACDYPHRVDVPDGATATKEEMITGQRDIKNYMAAMEKYLSCIEAAEQKTVAGTGESGEDARQQEIQMFNKKYNAAVEEMNLVAEKFNVQVRTYKERSK